MEPFSFPALPDVDLVSFATNVHSEFYTPNLFYFEKKKVSEIKKIRARKTVQNSKSDFDAEKNSVLEIQIHNQMTDLLPHVSLIIIVNFYCKSDYHC